MTVLVRNDEHNIEIIYDAINNVFYGEDGIDMAYQHERITWKEHQMLLALIGKLA